LYSVLKTAVLKLHIFETIIEQLPCQPSAEAFLHCVNLMKLVDFYKLYFSLSTMMAGNLSFILGSYYTPLDPEFRWGGVKITSY
jgi:hypothetical protein